MNEHVGEIGNPDCNCLYCDALRKVQDEVARESPWCGTCNPAVRPLVADSPEYRRWFEQRIREGGDTAELPVPPSLDPTVKT